MSVKKGNIAKNQQPSGIQLHYEEYCSCGVKTTCYHKIAVKKSIGLEIETRRKINLTELKRKRKPKGEGKSGRKRSRANDYDVIPADPGKQSEEHEPEGDQREGDEHISITDVSLEPGNADQIASCHRLDGPVWKQIDDMQLRQEEKEIRSHRGDWLNDRIMDAAQTLLRRQFPYISGFDTVLKAQNLSYDCCLNNPFIQIVNRTAMKGEGSHWLMLSTLDCRPRKEVKIYDSAYESVSFDTQEAICNLIKYGQPPRKNDNINLLVMDVDMQGKGEEDTCGLHAIANALSLALGIDPTEISYDERAMQEHLFNCLEEEFLTMFPHSSRSSLHKKGVKKT